MSRMNFTGLLLSGSCGLALAIAGPASGTAASDPPAKTELQVTTGDGIRLRLVRIGKASNKPPLLLVSGWTIGLEAWESVAAELAIDRQVFMLDSRSQGGSTVSTSANTPEDRGRDLATVMSQLKLRRPIVIAWSQGVQDLAAYVKENSDSGLSGSVLVDALPSGGANDLAARPEAAKPVLERLSIYRQASAAYEREMMKFIVTRPDGEAIRTRLARIALSTPPTIGADMLVSALFGEDRTAVRFGNPVLVIAAASNSELPAMREWVRERNSRLCEIDGAGHAVFVDQPRSFVQAFTKWDADPRTGEARYRVPEKPESGC